MAKEVAISLFEKLVSRSGRENAVKRPENSSDDRTFRDLIKLGRDMGVPIIPSENGYYVVDMTREDERRALDIYIRQECHRQLEKRKSIEALSRTLREKTWTKDGLKHTEVC